MTPIRALRRSESLSERAFAQCAGLSRAGTRRLENIDANVTLNSLAQAGAALHRELYVLLVPEESDPEYSVFSIATQVLRDGEASWKIHFMNFVDEFRRTLDPTLLILPPPRSLNSRLRALLASIVVQLSEECGISPPRWARKNYFLPEPWFVANAESLKATAILESPLSFRKNNIFVQGNFLERA